MSLTLAEFVTKYNLKGPMNSAHGLLGECVSLVEACATEVLGDREAVPFAGNAIDIFGQRSAPGGYRWVRNDPSDLSQVPPRGAIMVWGASPAVGTGPLGHVDIVLDATGTYFNGFDQNWPLGSGPRIVRHSYIGVIGWGYPQIWNAQPIPILPQQPPAVPALSPATSPPLPVPAPSPTPAPPPSVPPAPVNPPLVSPPPLTGPSEFPGGVPPVASNPPVPDVVPPEVPEPPIVAEQGVTTSEWKLVVGYLAQAAAIGTADLVNYAGQLAFHASVTIPAQQLQLLVDLEFVGGAAVIGYAVSRGIRKLGAR